MSQSGSDPKISTIPGQIGRPQPVAGSHPLLAAKPLAHDCNHTRSLTATPFNQVVVGIACPVSTSTHGVRVADNHILKRNARATTASNLSVRQP